MKIRNIFVVFVILFIVGGTVVKAAEPEITATSGAVIDCIDGKFLYSKNVNEKLYPASLTKVLTAILVVENCNMQDKVTISETAIKNVEYGYITSGLKVGEELTVEQLLNIALISSCNDVANALAEHVGGTLDKFVTMMNNKAKEIGCTNSHFVNCNGAHDENHYSTAHDMALIGKYAMQFDEIKAITGKTTYTLGATNKYEKDDRLFTTANQMILSGSSHYYKYASGIKTGFTTPAGCCFMAYAEKNNMPIVAVVLKSTTGDSRYDDARKILEYSFDNNTIRTIVKAGTNVQTLNIKNATNATKKLNVILEKDLFAVVKDENKEASVEPKITMKDKLKAPIKKGAVIGSVSYEIEGKTYTANLIAESNVEDNHIVAKFIVVFFVITGVIGVFRINGVVKRKKVLKKIRRETK